MVLLTIKILNALRKAIAGRRFPHQLAGGVALGVLLGIIPHGNLLAVVLLTLILCIRVNHAMVGLVAIAMTFIAASLDPYSHAVGQFVLTHPLGNEYAIGLWALPLVPWTDLNNTIVMGSFLIGLAGVFPIFAVTLPVFRKLAPATEQEERTALEVDDSAPAEAQNRTVESATPQRTENPIPQSIVIAQDEHDVAPPRFSRLLDVSGETDSVASQTLSIDHALTETLSGRTSNSETDAAANPFRMQSNVVENDLPTRSEMEAVQTRIDVIRIHENENGEMENNRPANVSPEGTDDRPIQNDEALNYLLSQLRNSQQRKAAG